MIRAPMSTALPAEGHALPGRAEAVDAPGTHYVFHTPLAGPFESTEQVLLAMGCFWGAERIFWDLPGVVSTAVGYAGGQTPNPTYEEVCSGLTGHAEVVRVAFDPAATSLGALLRAFWEGHDPTQGMRQGPDVGTQYRSAIYVSTAEQLAVALASQQAYEQALAAARRGPTTTEISVQAAFYFAEPYHQQYLAKHPGGYCGHGGTGICYPAAAPAPG